MSTSQVLQALLGLAVMKPLNCPAQADVKKKEKVTICGSVSQLPDFTLNVCHSVIGHLFKLF